jgi:flagella basal body P-ring formation protein FlgA
MIAMHKTLSSFIRLLPALMAMTAGCALAQTAAARQDPQAIRAAVRQYLTQQSAGLPGDVSVSVGQMDARLNVARCAALQPFLPAGSRAWGRTTVGVRCSAPVAWTLYVQASVKVTGDYVVTAAPLAQGQPIGAHQLAKATGDLASLPSGIITDPSQAIGRTPLASLPAGMPLRQDALRQQQVVQQGQTVRLMSSGPGFQVSSEARALNNAAEGQVAQARTPGGQVVSGIAKAGGILEVSY